MIGWRPTVHDWLTQIRIANDASVTFIVLYFPRNQENNSGAEAALTYPYYEADTQGGNHNE